MFDTLKRIVQIRKGMSHESLWDLLIRGRWDIQGYGDNLSIWKVARYMSKNDLYVERFKDED